MVGKQRGVREYRMKVLQRFSPKTSFNRDPAGERARPMQIDTSRAPLRVAVKRSIPFTR